MKNWILIICVLSNTFSCRAQEKKTQIVGRSGLVKFSHYDKKSRSTINDILEIGQLPGGRYGMEEAIIRGGIKKDTLYGYTKAILQNYMTVNSQKDYDELFENNDGGKIPRTFTMGRYFDHESMKINKGLTVRKDSTWYKMYDVTIINSIDNSSIDTCIVISTKYLEDKNSPRSKNELRYWMIKNPPEFLDIYIEFLMKIRSDAYNTLFNIPLSQIEDNDLREVVCFARGANRIFDVQRFFELMKHWKNSGKKDKVLKIFDL